jgi:hypothetical protein
MIESTNSSASLKFKFIFQFPATIFVLISN